MNDQQRSDVHKFSYFVLAIVSLLIAGYVIRGFTIPWWVNPKIEAEDRKALSTDIAPRQPLEIPRVVGIILVGGRNEYEKSDQCDQLCQTLLYTNSADAVITAPSINATPHQTQRWTIKRGSVPCTLPAFRSDRWEGLPQIREALLDRALIGDCVVRGRGQLGDADLVIGHQIIGKGYENADEREYHPDMTGGRISIWQRNAESRLSLTARETWRSPRRFTRFLHKEFNGSVNSPRLIFARLPEKGKTSPRSKDFQIEHFLKLKLKVPPATTAAELRAALDLWLLRTDLTDDDTGAQLGRRFGELAKKQPEPGDIERYEQAISNPRIYDWVVEDAIRIFPRSITLFSEAYLQRIAQEPGKSANTRAHGLDAFPPGAFARPSALMLDIVEGRRRSDQRSGLIVRFADGGPATAPILFRIYEQNLFKDREAALAARDEGGPDSEIAIAALTALCRLGPAIPPAYRRIEAAAVNDPEMSRWLVESQNGALVRVRLGRPLSTIELPGDEPDAWLRNVRFHLAKGECVP